jgi:hypothetical protein
LIPSANPRPTPGTQNPFAQAMREVPSYEPRCVVGNQPTPWELLATDVGAPAQALACACPGDPLFYSPGTMAQINPDGMLLRSDTQQRTVHAKGAPAILTMGRMAGFLRGLGQDEGDLPPDFFGGADSGPIVPDFSPTVITPPDFGIGITPPSGNIFALPAYLPPPIVPPATAAPGGISQAITALTNVGSAITKAVQPPTPTANAMTAAQINAAKVAANPLNQSLGFGGLTVGNLLLMAGVLIGGSLLISKTK